VKNGVVWPGTVKGIDFTDDTDKTKPVANERDLRITRARGRE
jgi:hypothetical protein